MMVQLQKTNYAIHMFDEQNSLLEQVWTNPNARMTTEDYKVDMWNYLKFVEDYQIKHALIDTQQFGLHYWTFFKSSAYRCCLCLHK